MSGSWREWYVDEWIQLIMCICIFGSMFVMFLGGAIAFVISFIPYR